MIKASLAMYFDLLKRVVIGKEKGFMFSMILLM